MTTFEKIVQAIKLFGYPYEPDLYTGGESRYFTYNYADDRGLLYGDNLPVETINSVQVHFFLPLGESFTAEKKRIRRALLAEGFTYPRITVIREEKMNHLIFECDIEEE